MFREPRISTLDGVTAAARKFVSREDDVDFEGELETATQLVLSFGYVPNDDHAFRRAACLCIECVHRYKFGWETFGQQQCEARDALDATIHWVKTGQHADGFQDLCVPKFLPPTEADPDSYLFNSLSEAASRTLYFCTTRNIYDASLVLCAVQGAADELAPHPDGQPFEDWIVRTGVVRSWNRNPLQGNAT